MNRRAFLGTTVVAIAAPAALYASAPLNVVATTGMVADTARQIGGDLVNVQALMGPGVDPHGYRQTRSDIVAMTRADLVLANGLYLEAQMVEFLEKLSKRTSVAMVAESVPTDLLRKHDSYANKPDPHVWMVPDLWANVVHAVRDSLISARPDAATRLTANADAYVASLASLQTYAETQLAQIPQERRVLVTAHDAFGYFGQAYGFEVAGIQGISTESEAGLNRIAALVDLLVDREIGAVFVESSVSDRNIRALIEGAAAKGHTVEIGGELFSDAMGPDGTYEGTYVGMIDHNITTIARALGAPAPERGLSGRLHSGS